MKIRYTKKFDVDIILFYTLIHRLKVEILFYGGENLRYRGLYMQFWLVPGVNFRYFGQYYQKIKVIYCWKCQTTVDRILSVFVIIKNSFIGEIYKYANIFKSTMRFCVRGIRN